MSRFLQVCLLAASVAPLNAQASRLGAAIIGSVVSDTGQPVPGAIITARRLDVPLGASDDVRSVPAFPDGAFAFNGLSAGRYKLCVQVSGSTLLDSCLWPDQKVSPIEVINEQIVSGVKLALKRGKVLRVHLDDPGGQFDRHIGKTPGAHVLVGIAMEDGSFLPAVPASKARDSEDLTLTIPSDKDVDLVVFSEVFQFANSNGTAFQGKRERSKVRAEPTDTEKQVTFRVTGASVR